MSDIAISVENIGKRYRIGLAEKKSNNAREAIGSFIKMPFRYLRSRLREPHPEEIIWALKNVSFEVKQGEVLGIIGRNGAGKSTLLKILSRITEPTEGWVKIYGRIGSLLEIGTGFHPELTGRENIYLNGSILGMRRVEIKRRFDEIVDFSGVEKFIDTPVKRYSSGMYVRLAFAVAAYLNTEILLVDEVLAVGDMTFQKQCLNKMQGVSQSGRTVLFVSHNMNTITRICERSILLSEGEIIHDGPSPHVVSAYLYAGAEMMAVKEWIDLVKAPGNDVARLSSVRVLDKTGNVCDTIDIREPVQIEVTYYNFPSDRFPYANIQLYDDDEVCLFASGDYTNQDWCKAPRTFQGKVTSTCIIPGNFLSDGRKRVLVGLTLHRPHEVICIEENVVSFTVVDTNEEGGVRGGHDGPIPGVVRPLLNWKVHVEKCEGGI